MRDVLTTRLETQLSKNTYENGVANTIDTIKKEKKIMI
jgi:hypothetical protein